MPRPGFERIASFAGAAEAEVVRSLLEASGIEAHVAGTTHLAREHFPTGEVAVLVHAEDVARAREIVASARVPDEPGAAPLPPPAPVLRKVAVAAGLALVVAGLALLLLAPGTGGTAEACLLVGALLAAVGAASGRAGRPGARKGD